MNLSNTDIESIRLRFPVLQQTVNGRPLIYFDNAATTQKPDTVIAAISRYYSEDNANIHRGIHTLAERATEAFEATRKAISSFLNSREPEECIFTKGTTEAINLVAQTYGRMVLQENDEVIISAMEHHSNIVPWQLICAERGAKLKVIPVNDAGELDMSVYGSLLSDRTRIVSCGYVSNALGTVNPVRDMIRKAHAAGAKVMLDGAQAASHMDLDMQELDCDFFALSAHKMYGPTGVGVLYGKRELLEAMPPYQGGGEMIRDVSLERSTWNDIPYKFEAGTPNIADVIAFREAIRFVEETGKTNIRAHENRLLDLLASGLADMPGRIRLYGTARDKVGVQSFLVNGMHAFDTGMLLDAKGIAVRTGHHCTQPLMQCYKIEGTVRVSFAVYNTEEEVRNLLTALRQISQISSR